MVHWIGFGVTWSLSYRTPLIKGQNYLAASTMDAFNPTLPLINGHLSNEDRITELFVRRDVSVRRGPL